MALSLSLNFPPGSLLVHWSWLCEPCLSLPSLFFLDQLTVNPLGVCVHVCVCVCVSVRSSRAGRQLLNVLSLCFSRLVSWTLIALQFGSRGPSPWWE